MKYKFQYAHPNVKKVFSVYPELDTSMLSQGVDAPHVIAEARVPIVEGLIACSRPTKIH